MDVQVGRANVPAHASHKPFCKVAISYPQPNQPCTPLCTSPQRIRGLLDASEPTRDTRYSRQALVDSEAAAGPTGLPHGVVLPELAVTPTEAVLQGGTSRARKRRGVLSWGPWGAGGAEGEEAAAVRRFQAFVRQSGLEEVMTAEDGRMWDMAHGSEGPQVRGVG